MLSNDLKPEFDREGNFWKTRSEDESNVCVPKPPIFMMDQHPHQALSRRKIDEFEKFMRPEGLEPTTGSHVARGSIH